MATKKSILEEVEINSHYSIYVQVTDGRGSLSFDDRNQQSAFWLTLEEMQQLADKINAAIKEAQE